MVLFINESIYHIYWYVTGGWAVASGLLEQKCGLSILMFIAVFYIDSEKARKFMFDLIFFWGLGGALQAILAPDIGARGFPDFKYFSFFLSHGFIMIGATYIIAGRRYRPTFKSLLIVVLFTNVLVAFSYGFNLLLELVPPYERGNYFITGYPPPTGSIVDLFAKIFGPSPRYIIGLELMGIAVFLLLWAPFAIARRPKAAKEKAL
ncbi:MAG: TIGR02206 family membrane protein [Spirochaetes bacterium]|nr:MAG: TIGR02206 family membrane protein [Spirochaetota bacterium]